MNIFSEKAIRGMTLGQIKKNVEVLASNIQEASYNLGGVIRRVRDEGLWREWGGKRYPSFDDWSWGVLGFKARKAEGLARIYVTLSELEIPGGLKKSLIELGWTKLRHLTRVIDEDNAAEWFKKGNTLSSRALEAEVRIATGTETSSGEPFGEPGVGPSGKARIEFKAIFDNADDYRFFTDALQVIERRTNTGSNAKILGMMASAYLAMHVRDDEGGMVIEVEKMLEAIERDYGIELKIIGKAKPRKRGRKKKVKAK